MAARMSYRVLRHERRGIVCLTRVSGMVIGAAEEPRDAGASRWKAVALPTSAVLCCLMPACGRTGAVGGPHRVASRLSGQHHAAQPVSTKALGAVHTRITTRIGAPQVGQWAASGGGSLRGSGWPSLGWACPISRRTVASGRAQLA